MAEALPSADDLLGPPPGSSAAQNALPTADSILDAPKGGAQSQDPESRLRNALGRAFIGGISDSFKEEFPQSPEQKKTENSFLGNVADAFLHPATTIGTGMQDIGGAVKATLEGGYEGAARALNVVGGRLQKGAAGVDKTLGTQFAAGMPTAEEAEKHPEDPGVGSALLYDLPLATGFQGLSEFAGVPRLPPQVESTLRNVASHAIGADERVYSGLDQPSPQQAANAYAAAAALPQQESALEQISALRGKMESDPQKADFYKAQIDALQEKIKLPATTSKNDIHEMARSINPDVIAERDILESRATELKNIIGNPEERRAGFEEGAKPHDDEIESLQKQLEEEKNKSEQRKIRAQIFDLGRKNDSWVDRQMKDSPEIAAARAELQKVLQRRGEIGPDVHATYTEAQSRMPKEEPLAEPPKEESPTIPVARTPAQEKQLVPIVTDMSKQLIAAGRPEEEANAAAQLVAEHYQARSERFEGKRGTAHEMYKRDMAEVKAGRKQKTQGATEVAQSARGAYRFATDEAKATIRLARKSDASTFIHETGHHWLDELLQDAAHPDAPEGLKADASAVRKWLGVGEAPTLRELNAEKTDLLYRDQHEKFARGFERYLMEGTAPSKALAEVFAKFKTWILNIYDTIRKQQKLSGINADIRGVFDRLLASKPEPHVIASERETVSMHEALAEHTPPQKAEATADNVHSAVERLAKNKDKEVSDGLDTKVTETEGAGLRPAESSGTSQAAESGQSAGESNLTEPARNTGAKPGIKEEKAGNIRTKC